VGLIHQNKNYIALYINTMELQTATNSEKKINRLPIRVIINATIEDSDNIIMNNKLMDSSMFNGPPGTTFYIPNKKIFEDTKLQTFIKKIISKSESNQLTDDDAQYKDKLAALEIMLNDVKKFNTKFNEYSNKLLVGATFLKIKVKKTHVPVYAETYIVKKSDIIKYNNNFIKKKLEFFAMENTNLNTNLNIPIGYVWYRKVMQTHDNINESYKTISSSHSDCLNLFEILESVEQSSKQYLKNCTEEVNATLADDVSANNAEMKNNFYVSCIDTPEMHPYIICYYCKKYLLPEYCSEEKYPIEEKINKITCSACNSDIFIKNQPTPPHNENDVDSENDAVSENDVDNDYKHVINPFAVIITTIENILNNQNEKLTTFIEILKTPSSFQNKLTIITKLFEIPHYKNEKHSGKYNYITQFRVVNELFIASNKMNNPTTLNDDSYNKKLNNIFIYFEKLVDLICYQPREWLRDITYIGNNPEMYHQSSLYNNAQIEDKNIKFFFNKIFAPSTQITLDKKDYMILDLHSFNKNPNVGNNLSDTIKNTNKKKKAAEKIKNYAHAIKRFYERSMINIKKLETYTNPLTDISTEKQAKIFEYIAKNIIRTEVEQAQANAQANAQEPSVTIMREIIEDTFNRMKYMPDYSDDIINVLKESTAANSVADVKATPEYQFDEMLHIFSKKNMTNDNRHIINPTEDAYVILANNLFYIQKREIHVNSSENDNVTEYFVNISLSQYLIDENSTGDDCNNSRQLIINGLSSITHVDLSKINKKIKTTVKDVHNKAKQVQAKQVQAKQVQAKRILIKNTL
jgi:hypothetical protein